MNPPGAVLAVGLAALLVVALVGRRAASRGRAPVVRLTVTPNALPRRESLVPSAAASPVAPEPLGIRVENPAEIELAGVRVASGVDPVLDRLLPADVPGTEEIRHESRADAPELVGASVAGRTAGSAREPARLDWREASVEGWAGTAVFTASTGSASDAGDAAAEPTSVPARGSAESPAASAALDASTIPTRGGPPGGPDAGDAPATRAAAADALAAPPPDPDGGAGATDPCIAERQEVEHRTEEAAQAHAAHEAAAAELRRLRREHDAAIARAEAAGEAMDVRQLTEAKAAAQRAFRADRAAARDAASLERAAAQWLTTINELNTRVRAARRVAATERRRVTRLAREIETRSIGVDATRITLERAEAAVLDARESLAECAERHAHPPAGSAFGRAAPPQGPTREIAAGSGTAAAGGKGRRETAPATDTPAPAADGSPAVPVAPSGETIPPSLRPTLLTRILEFDERAVVLAAAALASGSPDQAHRWHLELSAFRDATVQAAIDAGHVDPLMDHPFWSAFAPEEAREIAAVLASLGYRYDGRGAFADGRSPSTRDLALAVGYAGIDPRRIRRWPAAAEIPGLLEGARVATVEFVLSRAPDLSLGQLGDMLGPGARALPLLWNEWGRVRPLLASPGP